MSRLDKLPKWAQEQIAQLSASADVTRALRWSDVSDTSPDITPAVGTLKKGFLFNLHRSISRSAAEAVAPACSTTVSHSYGRNDKTTTQGCRRLYSTRLRALRALRKEFEILCAESLAEIDREIQKEV